MMRGFETAVQKAEFWREMRGGRIPLKFAYIGEGATAHDDFAQQQNYKSIVGGTAIEIAALTEVLDAKAGPQRVCELGPGNAQHSIAFLKAFAAADFAAASYLGLDFSASLLAIAADRIRKSYPLLDLHSSTWDFDSGPTEIISDWRVDRQPILVLFLGHTLGNAFDAVKILRNLYDSCRPNDILLVGVALFTGERNEAIVRPYLNDAFQHSVLHPLTLSGIDLSAGRFSVRFCRESLAVIGEFNFEREVVIDDGEEPLSFKVGDRVECFFSRRFTVHELTNTLTQAGWRVKAAVNDENCSHVVLAAVRETD